MAYDPKLHGALCDECPLQGCKVVPPETGVRARIAIVGEAPGEQEEKFGRPFVGPSGAELDRAIRMAGMVRSDFHINNVLLCRPPDNELDKLLHKISKANQREIKEAAAEERDPVIIKTPIECCTPRVLQETQQYSDFITLGKVGTTAITGRVSSIMSIRGGLQTWERGGQTIQVMPTVHPAFILRQQRWAHVFRNDITKAVKQFRGVEAWTPPKITHNPSPEVLAAFLSNPEHVYAFDIETDGIECLTAHIRCIAIGIGPEVCVIGFRSIHQPKDREGLFLDFYTEEDGAKIAVILRDFFRDTRFVKVGHNAGYYDRIVLRSQLGVDPQPVYDTIMLHRNVESELPHSLAYVATLYTLAPAWKTDRENNKLALGGESDEELHIYCGKDTAITAEIFPPLVEQIQLRDQTGVWRMDQRIQTICADMHTVGMYVDQNKRLAEEKRLLRTRHTLLEEIRKRTGLPDFNPASIYHMRDLLFTRWKLEAPLLTSGLDEEDMETSSGDLSTGDLILRTLLTIRGVEEEKRDVIKLIRRYRKCLKILGTYVVKLRPWNMGADLGWDEDDDWVTREMRKKYGEEKRGIVNPETGRMHPGYNAHVAVTGRLSSSQPINCFDGETEILTQQGWVRFDRLVEGAPVAQWEERDGAISFVRPTAYHQGYHEGEMVRFQHQSADLLMTPNHRIPLRKLTGALETVTAEELLSVGAGRRTLHAGHVVDGPGVDLTEDELRFLTAVHADASFLPNGGLDVGFTRPRKIEAFRSILEKTGFAFKERHSIQGQSGKAKVRFYVESSPRLEHVLSFIQGEARKWGPWLFELSAPQRRVFQQELWFWDACWGRKSQYANKDEENVDWIQSFLVLNGIRTNKRFYTNPQGNSVWVLDVRRTETNAITHRAVREKIPWSGQVYCVTVPSDAIVVRRRGKVTITRQSQNFPSSQRSLVVAAPGHVLVGADMDQLELRIAASLWGVELYLRAFREGKDPHSMTAFAVFGAEFCKAAGLTPDQFERPGVLVGACYDEHGVFLKGISQDAKAMRDLSKAVQYASVGEEEQVAVLDSRGAIPIRDVKPGDWTWAWSTKRMRYEPTQVKAAWHHGKKACVRVNFAWGQGLRFTGSVVVTADHPMLLRNGELRHAGTLRPGDSLMPFRRRGGLLDEEHRYRILHPFNDARMVSEHRVVAEQYQVGACEIHVHHKDGVVRNNAPENLVVLASADHYKEHKPSLDLGRKLSLTWRSAVSDPKRRAAASRKAWCHRRLRQGSDKTFGPRGSLLDAHQAVIGVLKDSEVALRANCSTGLVQQYRKKKGVPPPVGQQGWLRWLLREDVLWRRLLHDNTDIEIVRLVESSFGVAVTRRAVHATRRLLGVPSVSKARKAVYPRRCSKLDTWRDRIGQMSDKAVAELASCTPQAVRHYRRTRGIPAYDATAIKASNHQVVSVESAGEFSVWDLEVEHEDHNFALAAGLFVHNSQYMATVETVHQLIQKTELPAVDPQTKKPRDDGTTDLPYATLPLRRVREMRDNWLKGAPQFETGWHRDIDEYRRSGYLREPVTGRRRDFLDGEEPNQIVNFKVQCVPGHVRVLTRRGYIPIRELQGLSFEAWTGLRWAPATCVSKGAARLREVRTNHVARLYCDDTHKFKVPDRSSYVWKEAQHLIANQRVCLDLARPLEFGAPLDPEDAYMLGLFIADGCAVWRTGGGNRGVTLSFSVGNTAATGPSGRAGEEAVTRIVKWAESRGFSPRVSTSQGCSNVTIGRNAAAWCRIWGINPGLKARSKRIPEVIWRADLAARRSFLQGLLSGDGTQTKLGSVCLNMCNPELLEEVALLSRTVGVDALSIRGPYRTNKDSETYSYQLHLSGAHVHKELNWGRACKYRSNNTLPQFECSRIWGRLKPVTASHKVLKSRIRGHAGAKSITPYSAQEMGVEDLYDHAIVTSVGQLDLTTEVFTLCVDDDLHQYVADGFIAKNSSGAALMNRAIIQLSDAIPVHKWGPGTGIINQCHDSIVVECPEDQAEWVAGVMTECMNQTDKALPGVVFSASPNIGKTWKEVG